MGVIDITKVLTPIEHLIPKIEPEVPILDIQQEDKKEEQIKEQTGSIATDQPENPIDSLTDIQSENLLQNEPHPTVTFITGGDTDEELDQTETNVTEKSDLPLVNPAEELDQTETNVTEKSDLPLVNPAENEPSVSSNNKEIQPSDSEKSDLKKD